MISGMAQSAISQADAECSVEHGVDYWEGDIVIDSEHSPACWKRRCMEQHPCHCLLPMVECLAKPKLNKPSLCRNVAGKYVDTVVAAATEQECCNACASFEGCGAW
jgi:hypothetical protein